MTIISDTLHYRADGTVSGVTRVTRESYTSPSGRVVTDDVVSSVEIRDVTALLDVSYAAFDAHNKSLEAQIVTEREIAINDKEQAIRSAAEMYAAELARKDEALAATGGALAALEAAQ